MSKINRWLWRIVFRLIVCIPIAILVSAWQDWDVWGYYIFLVVITTLMAVIIPKNIFTRRPR